MLSDGYWERRFARICWSSAERSALSAMPFTIVGVTPPEFFGVEMGRRRDISLLLYP